MNEYTPLEQTTMSVYLQICTSPDYDKPFSVNDITKSLGLEPFQAFDKGQRAGLLMLPANYALWRGAKAEHDRYSEELPNLQVLLNETISLLNGKQTYLSELKRDGVQVSIIITPIILDGISPILTIGRDIIEFCLNADITIEFDSLICPFEAKKK